jgi:transposase-like protein
MMAERGIVVSHTTIMRWVLRYGCGSGHDSGHVVR